MGVSSHHDAIPTPLMTNTVRIRRGVSAAKDEVGLKRAAAPASLPSGASGAHHGPGTWVAWVSDLQPLLLCNSRMPDGPIDGTPEHHHLQVTVTAPLVHPHVSWHSPSPC
jgi:hypothetical protein